MPVELEWRMWRQLKNFGVDRFVFVPIVPEMDRITVDSFSTMEEALKNINGNRVFLEPKGIKGMYDLPPRNEDVVFILGNTSSNNLKYADNKSYKISGPKNICLYPTNAASIALAYWFGQ